MFMRIAVTSIVLACALTAAGEAYGRLDPATPVAVPELANDLSPRLAQLSPSEATLLQPESPTFRPGIGGGDLLGPVQSFEGVANDDNGTDASARFSPPDPEGDVGPRHYVQWVNTSLAVYDKTGRRLLGPVPGNLVWSGFGLADGDDAAARLCDTTNRGDPVVAYDQLADRWVLSQFAWQFSGPRRAPPYVQCLAVSATPDPMGRYFRYAFRMPENLFNDYAKLGVWPGTYIVTVIATSEPVGEDEIAGEETRAGVIGLDRSSMLAGLPTTGVFVLVDSGGPLLPADLDGPAAPPGPTLRPLGDPILVGFEDDELNLDDTLTVWRFRPDFNDPTASLLSGPVRLRTSVFDSSLCAEAGCIGQPGAGAVDALSDRLMFRAEYRRFGTYDALALTHTVRADPIGSRAGLRWYELRDSGHGLKVARQDTFAPADDLNRWLGSAALDGRGDVGLAFSVSGTGAGLFPSIGYTGIPADPETPLPGEGRLALGDGSQTGGQRWGDYGSLTVDPVDGCSFWLTQEYYPASSPDGWHTRIGSFRFPTCGAVTTIAGTIREGELLTAAPGSWPEPLDASFRYQWRRCGAGGGSCTDIAGAVSRVYRLTSSDVDWTIRVAVTAVSVDGIASSLSRQTGVVTPLPASGPVDLATTTAFSSVLAALGDEIELTTEVSNRGGGTATGVRLSIDLPPGLEFLSSFSERGPGCTVEAAIVCDLEFLPADRTATLKAHLRVVGRGPLGVTAAVRGDQVDPVPGNNGATTTIVASGAPTLFLLDSLVEERPASRGVVAVTAAVSIDEPAALTLTAIDSGGRRLRLLAGSSLPGRTLRASALELTGRAQSAGTIGVRARLPGQAIVSGARYRLVLRAQDADGFRSSIAIPFARGE
jgi:uncharacterized repeat protein (TIGR01451 family)